MDDLTTEKAKNFFAVGVITGFEIARMPMKDETWNILVTFKEGASYWLRERRQFKIREFKTINAAVLAIATIRGDDVERLRVVA